MVETENENTNIEREIERCSWCNESDREKKVYASPGDDLENPKAYHEKCFEAVRMFMMLAWRDKGEKTLEELMEMANKLVGIKKKKKKK